MSSTPFKSPSLWFDENTHGAIWHDYCYFIRHGETSWNRERRTMGWTDIPLSDIGVSQADEAQKYVKDLGIQTICTSPLQRAHQTANILNQILQVPLVKFDNLKEIGWGDHEGQIRVLTGDQMFVESKHGQRPTGAESYETFEKRALSGFKESLTNPGPVLIVSHGGVFWALANYFNWPVDKLLTNCELIQIFFPRAHGDWVVRQVA
jgi:probable phosphoglycerate mutase